MARAASDWRRRFVTEGAFVFVTGRRQTEFDMAIKDIGENVRGVQGDVSNLEDLDRLMVTIKNEKGSLDVVFANAGWGELVPLDSITEEHFERTFATNVMGVAFTVQKALPVLKDGSAIVLNGSIAGSMGKPVFSLYAATKAAVRSFARSWSVDLKMRKVHRGGRFTVLDRCDAPNRSKRNTGIFSREKTTKQ